MSRPRRSAGGTWRSSAALCVACLAYSPGARADEDAWFGRDKALHFGVSIVLGAGGYAASALAFDDPWARAACGASFSMTLGVGKEVYDHFSYGRASARDLVWDAAGTLVGVGIAALVDLASRDSPPRETANAQRGFRVRF